MLSPLTSSKEVRRRITASMTHNLGPVSPSRVSSPRPEPLSENRWWAVARQLDRYARVSGLN